MEIHRYRVLVQEEQRLLRQIRDLEQMLGTVMAHKLGSMRRLEASAALECIEEAQHRYIHTPSIGQPYGSHDEIAKEKRQWEELLKGHTDDLSWNLL